LFYTYTPFIFVTILCAVMGITLLIFLMYHLAMVKSGLTTNERIKKSCIMSMLSDEIKRIKKEKVENDEVKQKDMADKLEILKKDYDTLKNMKSEGFLKNMKEIIFA